MNATDMAMWTANAQQAVRNAGAVNIIAMYLAEDEGSLMARHVSGNYHVYRVARDGHITSDIHFVAFDKAYHEFQVQVMILVDEVARGILGQER